VQQDAKPFLIENIGNYQREMIYLTGGRIGGNAADYPEIVWGDAASEL